MKAIERQYDYHFQQAVASGTWHQLCRDQRWILQDRREYLNASFKRSSARLEKLKHLEETLWKCELRLAARGPGMVTAAEALKAAGAIDDFELELELVCYWAGGEDPFFVNKLWFWDSLSIGTAQQPEENYQLDAGIGPAHTPSRIFRYLVNNSPLALQDLLEIDMIWLDYELRYQVTASTTS